MQKIVFSAIVLLSVSGCAVRLPEDELSSTRSNLKNHLLNQDMPQSEINIVSAYIYQLANMEQELLEYRIVNQSNYSKIEKAFNADCEAWKKHADQEASNPSQYEGGSFAPTANNLQMTYFVEKRIGELRNKWRQK